MVDLCCIEQIVLGFGCIEQIALDLVCVEQIVLDFGCIENLTRSLPCDSVTMSFVICTGFLQKCDLNYCARTCLAQQSFQAINRAQKKFEVYAAQFENYTFVHGIIFMDDESSIYLIAAQ